jgi:dienelactone hydrolase
MVDRTQGHVTMRVLPAILAACAAFAAGAAHAATPVYRGPLYDAPAKGSEGWTQERVVIERGAERSIYNTREPQYELYLPDPAVANGAAVIMLPGGGMRVLGVGKAMRQEIDAFLGQGVAVALLEYRTLQMPPEAVERAAAPPPPDAPPMRCPKMQIVNGNANPAKGNAEMAALLELAISDAQAMLAMMHERAGEWGIDPARIGLVGTSAGGGVAFGALLADAPPGRKPDFLVSIYGPSLQDVAAPADAPPLFLITEADHGPVTDGLMAVFSIWKDAGQRAELHVYEVPNFSMTIDLWGARLFDWMREQAILPTESSR